MLKVDQVIEVVKVLDGSRYEGAFVNGSQTIGKRDIGTLMSCIANGRLYNGDPFAYERQLPLKLGSEIKPIGRLIVRKVK